MNEKIKEFLQKVAGDEALAAKLEACKSPDEAYALASGMVEGFTKDEFVSVMEKIKAATENGAELSDEDLSKMAGGVDWTDVGVSAAASSVSSAVTWLTAISAASAI